jgi:aspartyl-tRNA(Asn)/glutamyl-tRNA(Gln) amidotransferase subunit A
VSVEGAAPLAWSLDHAGPMCRTVTDAAAMLAVIAGTSLAKPPVRKLRLGVPRALFYDGLDSEVSRAMDTALETLGRLTAGVRDVTLPALPESPNVPPLPLPYIRIIGPEAYAFHERMLRDHPERYHAGTRASLQGAAGVTASEYILARREMDRLRKDVARHFEQVDLLITPTSPGPAFELGSRPGLVFLRNTAPWNLYGLPTISIPCGFTPNTLPIGLQITGAAGRDDLVLALAAAYDQATDWHTRHPR